MTRILYFGHPINVYGTELERFLVGRIRAWLPLRGFTGLLDPSGPEHQRGYEAYEARGERGMDYFFKDVLPGCHGGVMMPFRDRMFGAGVYGEAEHLAARACPLWEISPEGVITPFVPTDSRRLTVPETLARIFLPDGTSRPY